MARLLPICCLLFTACGKDEGETPYDHQAGTYDVVFLSEWDQGDCEFETIFARFDLVSTTVSADAEAGTMDIAFDDGDQSMVCGLDINTIDCDSVELFDTDLAGDGEDAVVTTSFTLSGEWTADDAFGGVYTHSFSCEGDDCAALDGTAYGSAAAFPCTLGGDYAASLQ